MVVDFYVGFVAGMAPVGRFSVGCCVERSFGLRCCRYEKVGLRVFGVDLEFEDFGWTEIEGPVLCHCRCYACWRCRMQRYWVRRR